MANRMAHPPQLLRQLPHALARPPQWRLRVSTGHWLDQAVAILAKRRIRVNRAFPTAARSPNADRPGRRPTAELLDPLADHAPRHTGRTRHRTRSAPTDRQRFTRRQQPTRPLIEMPGQQRKPSLDRLYLCHAPQPNPGSRSMLRLFPDESLVRAGKFAHRGRHVASWWLPRRLGFLHEQTSAYLAQSSTLCVVQV